MDFPFQIQKISNWFKKFFFSWQGLNTLQFCCNKGLFGQQRLFLICVISSWHMLEESFMTSWSNCLLVSKKFGRAVGKENSKENTYLSPWQLCSHVIWQSWIHFIVSSPNCKKSGCNFIGHSVMISRLVVLYKLVFIICRTLPILNIWNGNEFTCLYLITPWLLWFVSPLTFECFSWSDASLC